MQKLLYIEGFFFDAVQIWTFQPEFNLFWLLLSFNSFSHPLEQKFILIKPDWGEPELFK